jgi:hypothetical protein
MLFPRGTVLYENLNTSFAQLDAMLAELQSTQFTGYVQLTGWEYDGVLLFDTGRIVNALETTKSQQRSGPNAAASIAVKAKEKDNAINVYRLQPDIVQLLANVLTSEPVYKDLSNDLTPLDKLLAKLQGEKHTGAVMARWERGKDAAMILLREGQVIESVLFANGKLLSGTATLNEIVQAASRTVVLFTVYKADLARVYSADLDLAESFARPQTLAFWQTILNLVERVADEANKPGTFNLAFRRACVALANTYPFLDPFAAEFEYRDGRVTFEGQATVARFNAGLRDAVVQTARDLAASSKLDLLAQLREAAAQVRAEHAAQLERTGLAIALPEVFQA